MRLRRSMLYVPGNSPSMIQNAHIYGADSILLDLEDSVPLEEKDAARELVRMALSYLNFEDVEVTVRINPLDTAFGVDDLHAVALPMLDAVRLPKASCPEDVKRLSDLLTEIEEENGLERGRIHIHPMIETAVGVENAFLIARASERVDAITIGGQDLTADMGVVKTEEGVELLYPRMRVVMAAKAAGIDALDTVYADVNDAEGLKKEALMVKRLGFTGKAAIHPNQIGVINGVFSPSEEEVEEALRIVKASLLASKEGKGVVVVDGKMVDLPVVKRAKRILMLAGVDFDV